MRGVPWPSTGSNLGSTLAAPCEVWRGLGVDKLRGRALPHAAHVGAAASLQSTWLTCLTVVRALTARLMWEIIARHAACDWHDVDMVMPPTTESHAAITFHGADVLLGFSQGGTVVDTYLSMHGDRFGLRIHRHFAQAARNASDQRLFIRGRAKGNFPPHELQVGEIIGARQKTQATYVKAHGTVCGQVHERRSLMGFTSCTFRRRGARRKASSPPLSLYPRGVSNGSPVS